MEKSYNTANTQTNGSKMVSLDFSTQEGVLNLSHLATPIQIVINKNADVGIVQLEEMHPNDYGYGLLGLRKRVTWSTNEIFRCFQ